MRLIITGLELSFIVAGVES